MTPSLNIFLSFLSGKIFFQSDGKLCGKAMEFLFLSQSTREECLYKQKHRESKQIVTKQLFPHQHSPFSSNCHSKSPNLICFVFNDFNLFSCPGRMIANSIPARLVATRMRVVWPRARACPCHARVRLDLPCTCARMCHAQRPS